MIMITTAVSMGEQRTNKRMISCLPQALGLLSVSVFAGSGFLLQTRTPAADLKWDPAAELVSLIVDYLHDVREAPSAGL